GRAVLRHAVHRGPQPRPAHRRAAATGGTGCSRSGAGTPERHRDLDPRGHPDRGAAGRRDRSPRRPGHDGLPGGAAGRARTGDALGTLRYMSPEQALAKRVVIDGRTDIYSLGVTLYELLTLRPAIDGQDRQEILRKVAQEEPVPPRRLNPAVPRDLETIVL